MSRHEVISTLALEQTAVAKHRRRIRPWLASAIIMVVIAVALAGWYATRPISVTAARAARGPAASVVYATGYIEPRNPVDVSSRVTAPVAQVLADEGDRVALGEGLVVLDSADLNQALAELSASRINAEQDEQRALALFRRGFLARAARDKAVAAASSARAAEAAARARLNQYVVRSGIAGVVLRRDVEPGELATPTKTLFQIGDPNALRITATVDERDIPLVRRGAQVMMSSDAYPGRVIRGAVYEITPGGDPEQRAFRVRIRPDNMADLPVGLTLEVNILISKKANALLVPGGALRRGNVWIVADGRSRLTKVRTGIRGEKSVEIVSGLGEGACVIVDPSDDLEDGKRVSATGC
jgi:RND family efflux transporter MFP subunit